MSKDRLLSDFKDIVEPRKKNNDAVSFMTRHWAPQPGYRVNKILTPTQLKTVTSQNWKLDQLLDELSPIMKKSKSQLKKEVTAMLDEIGLERKMYVVRWLGVVTTKFLCRLYTSVFVNERNMFALKSTMGPNPVVFVPTHRSYADFILMTYTSYYYDIELPSVAAGMDFHAMVGMGRIMRDTSAFYMRRTFATDRLYSAVFRQYVRTLVVSSHSPLEFFIEGTRSRSGKSMAPKYGFMSMVLEPYFMKDVPDVTFVPINISYDRVLEEKLFAYELLGVPKPKESTAGLLRGLNILNENFGNIYINIGQAVSAKEYLKKYVRRNISDDLKPMDLMNLTPEQNGWVQSLSHEIIYRQQQCAIVTTFQMVSVALTMSLHQCAPFSDTELGDYIIWLSEVLKALGGNSFDYDKATIGKELNAVFATHQYLIRLDKQRNLRLINTIPFFLTDEVKRKMKGHELSAHTIDMVIPVVMIQLYVNPVLHWIISSSGIQLIVRNGTFNQVVLWDHFKRFRTLLKYEFPVNEPTLAEEFKNSLAYLSSAGGVVKSSSSESEMFTYGSNTKLHNLLSNLMWPFLSCVYTICIALSKESSIEEKAAVKLSQKTLEWKLTNEEDIHPYSLSLDSILNCIQGLVADGALQKERKNNSIMYNINREKIAESSKFLEWIMPDIHVKFDHSNPVMVEPSSLLSRL